MSIRKRDCKKSALGYTYQVSFSYTDYRTQEKKTHTKSGFQCYEDAKLYEETKRNELSYQHQYLKKYKITLNQLFDEWMEVEAKYLFQDNTIIDYRNRYHKHIQYKIGNYLVKDLDYKVFQQYFNDNSSIGLSTNYKLKKILNGLMNFALKCGYCTMNPIPLVFVSGVDNSRASYNKVYSDDDFEKVIQHLLAKKTHLYYVYALALYIGKYTGLRVSETFALTQDDFNFENQTIYISKKLVYANLKKDELYVQKQMKSKASKSYIPFHKDLQEIIKKWMKYHPNDYVISDTKGNLLNPKQLEYALWKISKETNIHFHYHMLRHTLATRLVNNGADLKSTQEIMRHANISTTMNIYTHVNDDNKLKALYVAFPEKK